MRRHTLTSRASLEFDAVAGVFQLRAAATGVALRTEFDMLPPQREPPEMWTRLQHELQVQERDPWNAEQTDELLEIITNSLDPSGHYDPKAQRPRQQIDETLRVEFAPAIFLRKRTAQGVHEMLAQIDLQLRNEVEPPAGWKALTGDLNRDSERAQDSRESSVLKAEDFLFPLHTNEEQEQILRSLKDPVGALVQGPPGTGKSHTIANLICHLLATGNRILITSQKSRALEVLDEKLPELIRPLCVSFVGSGADEHRSLERSVRGICAKQDSPDTPDTLEQSARHAAKERAAARQKMTLTMGKIRDIGEFETKQHTLPGYRGTAARIAERIEKEREQFAWLTDSISELPDDNVLQADYLHALNHIRSRSPDYLAYARGGAGDEILEIPDYANLAQLYADERAALEELERHDDPAITSICRQLDPSSFDAVCRLLEALDDLEKIAREAKNRPHKWVEDAYTAMLTKQERPWKSLYESTTRLLDSVAQKLPSAENRIIYGHDRIDPVILRQHAATLLSHIQRVGHARFLALRGHRVRQARYVTKITVNGVECDSQAAISDLIEHLYVEEQLRLAWNLWRGKAAATSMGLKWQYEELAEHQESLGQLVGLYDQINAVCLLISEMPFLSEPSWVDNVQRRTFLDACRRRKAEFVLQNVRNSIEHAAECIRACGSQEESDRSSLKALISSIDRRDIEDYRRTQMEIVKRREDAKRTRESLSAFQSLGRSAPSLAGQIMSFPNNPNWELHLARLPEAMRHIHAKSWLDSLLNNQDGTRLSSELDAADRIFRDSTAKEATHRAWAHCLSRLSSSHRQSLISWQQSVKSLGKGTGKMAGKWRRAARDELQRCQSAIPAWVMPLHRVFESVRPEPGMFDYIIVDEASQSGPDALPLFYLGKKIIIVGDDKQISPTHFVNLDVVESLIQRHLSGFDRPQAFSIERSLFDHGELCIGNRIVLREHFRCMPEIIRFSNNLMYTETPLEPLRQYGPDRLPPLQHRHVSNGVKVGQGSHVLNKPEAEAVASAVVQSCRDARYTKHSKKMTMGVISLQGGAQADYIESLLLEQLGPEELEARDLMCGDAYTFQGSERDVIFLSLVAAGPDRIGSLTKHSDRQRFNVAASRAREQMWLFHSIQPGDLGPNCVRRALLEYVLNPNAAGEQIRGVEEADLRRAYREAQRDRESPPRPFDSWFEVEVALELAARGYKVVPQFPAGGYSIDLVVEGASRRLAVECDGDTWHGAEQRENDLYRQRKLERAGWTFLRIRASAFHASRTEELQRLERAIRDLGICSGSAGASEESSIAAAAGIDHGDNPGREDVIVVEEFADAATRDIRSDPSSEELDDIVPDPEPRSEAEPQLLLQPILLPAESSLAEPFSDIPDDSDACSNLILEAFVGWSGGPFQPPLDSTASQLGIELLEIITVEAPVRAKRVYHLHASAAGLQRVGSEMRKAYNKALHELLRTGAIEGANELGEKGQLFMIVRPFGTPRVRLRAAGDRSIDDIPPSEIAAVMSLLKKDLSRMPVDSLFKQTLRAFGFSRLREPTRFYLGEVRDKLLRDTFEK